MVIILCDSFGGLFFPMNSLHRIRQNALTNPYYFHLQKRKRRAIKRVMSDDEEGDLNDSRNASEGEEY